MVRMTHTKGPWEIQETNAAIYILGDTPGYLARVHHKAGPDETYGNAHLIGAAPDLLEALEAVMPWASKAVADHYNQVQGKRALERAWAAIAKVRGE